MLNKIHSNGSKKIFSSRIFPFLLNLAITLTLIRKDMESMISCRVEIQKAHLSPLIVIGRVPFSQVDLQLTLPNIT